MLSKTKLAFSVVIFFKNIVQKAGLEGTKDIKTFQITY